MLERGLKQIGPDTAALLRVHASNFRIVGFTEQVAIGDAGEVDVNVDAEVGLGRGDLRPIGARIRQAPEILRQAGRRTLQVVAKKRGHDRGGCRRIAGGLGCASREQRSGFVPAKRVAQTARVKRGFGEQTRAGQQRSCSIIRM